MWEYQQQIFKNILHTHSVISQQTCQKGRNEHSDGVALLAYHAAGSCVFIHLMDWTGKWEWKYLPRWVCCNFTGGIWKSNKSLAKVELYKHSYYKYFKTDIMQQPMTVPHPSAHPAFKHVSAFMQYSASVEIKPCNRSK